MDNTDYPRAYLLCREIFQWGLFPPIKKFDPSEFSLLHRGHTILIYSTPHEKKAALSSLFNRRYHVTRPLAIHHNVLQRTNNRRARMYIHDLVFRKKEPNLTAFADKISVANSELSAREEYSTTQQPCPANLEALRLN